MLIVKKRRLSTDRDVSVLLVMNLFHCRFWITPRPLLDQASLAIQRSAPTAYARPRITVKTLDSNNLHIVQRRLVERMRLSVEYPFIERHHIVVAE